MITQFYIIEIQQYLNGQFGHIIHFAYDIDPKKAQLKAEAKYHEVLAAAAVSELPSHSATIIASNGAPVAYQCYTHEVQPEPTEPQVQPTEPEVQPTEPEVQPQVQPTEPQVQPTEPQVQPTVPQVQPTVPESETQSQVQPTEPEVQTQPESGLEEQSIE